MDRLFQKGDRVIGTGYCCGVDITGRTGTVLFGQLDCLDSIGVCFDESYGFFHDLGGYCAYGHGFWVGDNEIQLIHGTELDEWDLGETHNDLCELL